MLITIAPPLDESRVPWIRSLLESKPWSGFIVESAAGESFLKSIGYQGTIAKLNEHTRSTDWIKWKTMLQGCVGLLSDFGFPVLADPGFQLIRQCHLWDIKIKSIGVHSPVMATLIMSGCDANRYTFFGYPIRGRLERRDEIQNVIKHHPGETLVFIETPYRFHYLFNDLLEFCPIQTWICMGLNIGQPDERCLASWIEAWKAKPPILEEKPLGVIVVQLCGIIGNSLKRT